MEKGGEDESKDENEKEARRRKRGKTRTSGRKDVQVGIKEKRYKFSEMIGGRTKTKKKEG